MTSRSKQTRFSNEELKVKDQFGGSLLKKRRNRTARPLSTKLSMHLILKSSSAKGRYSLRAGRNRELVDAIVERHARRNGVKLLKSSNNFNHLHLHVKIASRGTYKRFIKAVSGAIAMAVTGASKSKSMADLIGKSNFWDARPYSRVVRGWRGFKTANDYVVLNQLEAEGVVPKRDSRLRGVREHEWRHFRTRPTCDAEVDRQRSFLDLG